MDTVDFLRAVLPDRGWYCLVIFYDERVRQFWYDTIEGAASAAKKFDASMVSVYHACASFKEKGSRKSTNVLAVKSAWMDLDVGEGDNKFATITEAGEELKKFVQAHALPRPLVVSSGGGIHAYWPYEQSVEGAVGKTLARDLKALAIADGFNIDPSRTADLSSILRPVGTHNHKYSPAREVQVVVDAPPTPFNDLAALIARDAPKRVSSKKTDNSSPNADFLWTTDYPPSLPDVVADKCAQIRAFRDSKGNIDEPVWYAGIEVLYHCEKGIETIHEWSSGHPDYTPAQTDAKIGQIKNFGPTTCVAFEQRNPSGCADCPHKGKITSPIQLGVQSAPIVGEPVEEAVEETVAVEGFIDAPHPFKRTKHGVVYTNEDGIEVPVYPYDLVVSDIAYDPVLGYAVATIKHHLPQDGWQEFSLRASEVGNPRDFERAMRDQHVIPRNSKLLQSYINSYMQCVQTLRKTRILFNNFGWNGDHTIVLGDTAYYSNGQSESAGLSESLRTISDAFIPKGTLEPWVEATKLFDQDGMEAHAFMFSAAPGALLMRFSGFEATMFNALGQSNSGKTMMGRFMMSMYGDYDVLKLKKDDTDNAKIGRIAILGSLPTYIEEVTNEESEKVSDFCYEVTQGRSKLRLRQDGTEREVRRWNTIVVSSANTSLSAKLGLAKSNPDAERLRLFEFPVERTSLFERGVADDIFWTLSNNYGEAGIHYVRWLVQNASLAQRVVQETIAKVAKACSSLPEERMWVASVGCCIAGLHLMHQLGLIRFDVKRVAKWAVAQITMARTDLSESRISAVELLGLFLNESTPNRLVVREEGMGVGGMTYHEDVSPRGPLYVRFDATRNRAWVEQQHFRRWCIERHEDFRKVRQELVNLGVVLSTPRRTLGKGTSYAAGAVITLELDMEHPAMGNITARAVPPEPKAERFVKVKE